jgi:putative peptide zinc metalloprotease protein
LGIEQQENPFLPQRNQFLFGLFTVGAVIYRWVIVFGIIYFLNRVFEPIGLKRVGQLFALAGFVGMFTQPMYQLYTFLNTPGRISKVKKTNVGITLGIAGAVVLAFFFLPLPHAVKCSFEVQPRNARPVYAAVPGRLQELKVRPGDKVQEGQVLATLSNDDLEHDYQIALGAVDNARAELESLQLQKFKNPSISLRIEEAQKGLESAEKSLAEKAKDRERLTLVAPAAGTIIPPTPRREKPGMDGAVLPKWNGTPFDERNRDAWFAGAGSVFDCGPVRRGVDQGQRSRQRAAGRPNRAAAGDQSGSDRREPTEIRPADHVDPGRRPHRHPHRRQRHACAIEHSVSGAGAAGRLSTNIARGRARERPHLHRLENLSVARGEIPLPHVPL